MGVAGSVIRIEGGLPENSDSIPGRPADDNASVAAHSSGSAAEASDHIADSPSPVQAHSTRTGGSFGTISPSKRDFANSWQSPGSSIRDIFEAVEDPVAVLLGLFLRIK